MVTEAQREYNKRYYQENKQKFKDTVKRFRQDNPDYQNQWRANNKDKVRAYGRTDYGRRAVSARRARLMGAFVENVSPSVVFERDGGVCQICFNPIGNLKWNIDHILPLVAGGEHSYANCQLTHKLCNVRKGAKVVG